jgi:hypothetical protein
MHILSLAVLLAAAAAEPAATAQLTPLAHSALLAVEGARSADTLTLRIHHPAEPTALTPAQLSEVGVMLAGRTLPLSAQPDGSWSVSLRQLGSRTPAQLDLVVGHDGIRELLSLQLGPDAGREGGGAAASGMSSRNKQLVWWVLNIAIVLVAAIAIARRRS